jgi:hypothetical protein
MTLASMAHRVLVYATLPGCLLTPYQCVTMTMRGPGNQKFCKSATLMTLMVFQEIG